MRGLSDNTGTLMPIKDYAVLIGKTYDQVLGMTVKKKIPFKQVGWRRMIIVKQNNMDKLNSWKDVNERAEMLFEKCILVNRVRERETAKQDAIHIVNIILISLEDLQAPNDLMQYWLKVKRKLEKY